MALLGTIVLGHAQTQINFEGVFHDFSIEKSRTHFDRVFDTDGMSTDTVEISTNEGNFIGSLSASLPLFGFGSKLKPGDPWNLRGSNWNLRAGAGLLIFAGESTDIKPSYHLELSYSRLELLYIGLSAGGFVTFEENNTSNGFFVKPELSYWMSKRIGLSIGATIFYNEKSTKNDLFTNPKLTLGLKLKL